MKSESSQTFLEVVNKLWAHKWRIVIITLATTAVGVIYVFGLPRGYTAKTKIVVERQEAQSVSGSMSMLSGFLGASGSANDGITIDLAPSIVQSIPFLLDFEYIGIELLYPVNSASKVIRLSDYLANYQKAPWWSFSPGATTRQNDQDTTKSKYILSVEQETFIKAVSSIFTVTTDKKTSVMTLSATAQDPLASVILVDSLAVNLQKYITAYQISKAQQELEQAIKIAAATRERYYNYQELYANSMDRNQNLIMLGAKTKTDRLQSDMNIAQQAYTAAASQVEMARTKVWENTPVFTVLDPPLLDKSASYPNRKLVTIVALLVGLFIGIGSVIASDIKNSLIPPKGDDITSH